MEREIEKDLVKWKNSSQRMPLLLRGACQVGKSYIIEKFGNDHFKETITLDFEYQPLYKDLFSTMDPHKIL